MTSSVSPGPLETWYERRIGEATTDDEIDGYWLFVVGVVVGILSLIVFAVTEGGTGARGVSYGLAGLAPVSITIGAIVRFPLRRGATLLATIGGLLSLAGIVWFLAIFPGGWDTQTGHMGVIATYAAGLLLIGVAGAFVPLATDPLRQEYEEMKAHSATERRSRAQEREGERAEASGRESDLRNQVTALEAELESIRSSQARFELFEDRAGKTRWRLRHRNGNVIADSGQGYSSRQKCQQGIQSVRNNGLGAGTLWVEPAETSDDADAVGEPADAADPEVAVPTTDGSARSQAAFELFEDNAGEWRWRLRHENGNIIADSGEGYSQKSNAKRAIEGVRGHVPAASYLDLDPVAYELYRDRAGDHRWRLLHENGNIIADSGEGYSSRSAARKGIESVRSNIADAEVEER